MISLVEYGPIERQGEEGVSIVFTYDHTIKDSYELYGSYVDVVTQWLGNLPNPELLLVEIRKLMNITVH